MKLIKIYSRHVKKKPQLFRWKKWKRLNILTNRVVYKTLILRYVLVGKVFNVYLNHVCTIHQIDIGWNFAGISLKKKRKERNLETYYKKYYKLTPIRERKNRMRIVRASSSQIFIAANQPLPNTCANNTGLDKTYSRRN